MSRNVPMLNEIRNMLQQKIYKIIPRVKAKSLVWEVFGYVQTDQSIVLSGFVACRECFYVMKYSKSHQSAMNRHKCYMMKNGIVRTRRTKKYSVKSIRLGTKMVFSKTIDDTKTQIKTINLPATTTKTVTQPTKKLKIENLVNKSTERVTPLAASEVLEDLTKLVSTPDIDGIPNDDSLLVRRDDMIVVEELAASLDDNILSTTSEQCSQFIISECLSPDIVEGNGLKNIVKYFIRLGALYGSNIDVDSILPNRSSVLNLIDKSNKNFMLEAIQDMKSHTEYGAAASIGVCPTNNNYISLTIHYIRECTIRDLFIGVIDLQSKICSKEEIKTKVLQTLKNFDLKDSENMSFVCEGDSMLVNAFGAAELKCSYNLLRQLITTACNKVPEIYAIIEECKQLQSYLINDNTQKNINYSLNIWDCDCFIVRFVNDNWNAISEIISQRAIADTLVVNKKHLEALAGFFSHIEKALTEMKTKKLATLHFVYMQIHILKKRSLAREGDSELITKLKINFLQNIQTVWIANLSNYHRMAVFLFPPTNGLLMFNEREKTAIKDQCLREIINFDSKTLIQKVTPFGVDNGPEDADRSEYFDMLSDILQESSSQESTFSVAVESEIEKYSKTTVQFTSHFDVLKWWDHKREEFPLLYALSSKILAIPATNLSSPEVFDKLIQLKSNYRNDMNDVNNILFLNSIQDEKPILNYIPL